MKNNNFKKKLSVVFFILFFSTFSTKIFAQEIIPLTVFPAITELKVKNNDKTRFQIQFKNNSKEIINGRIKVADYTIQDKEGSPKLIEDENIKTKFSASSWIKPVMNEIAIPAEDFVTVDFNVDVPKKTSSCGSYAVVYFEPNLNPQNKNESISSITTKIGALVNFELKNSSCKEEIAISRFSNNSFQEFGPINIKFDLFNNGNVHTSPKGFLQLTNIFGESIDQQKIKDEKIFPETAKEYESNIGSKWMIGRYKINLKGQFGNNQTFYTFSHVWVFPWRLVLLIILLIGLITYLISRYTKTIADKEKNLENQLKEEQKEIEMLKEKLKNKRE